jgi:hypothetical protein
MKKQDVVGSALVVIGVAAGSLLAPQAASALDFNYSFGGVTGLIEGLSEGINACLLTDTCRVTVTNNGDATGAPMGLSQPYSAVSGQNLGFNVFTPASGIPSIVAASWAGAWPTGWGWPSNEAGAEISFAYTPEMGGNQWGSLRYSCNGSANPSCSGDAGPIQFAAVSTPGTPTETSNVPGPLPVFGAATAFGYSCRLRRRIKATSKNVTTAPFA